MVEVMPRQKLLIPLRPYKRQPDSAATIKLKSKGTSRYGGGFQRWIHTRVALVLKRMAAKFGFDRRVKLAMSLSIVMFLALYPLLGVIVQRDSEQQSGMMIRGPVEDEVAEEEASKSEKEQVAVISRGGGEVSLGEEGEEEDGEEREDNEEKVKENENEELRYITTLGYCAGLGNMLWRSVALYAVGKKVGRRPYFAGDGECHKEYVEEVREIFPQLAKQITIVEPQSDEHYIVFAQHCCRYEDPMSNKDLVDAKAKYIRIAGDYLQHPAFLTENEVEIRESLLQFSPELIEKVDEMRREIFKDDENSHKLCVHIRHGHDFARLDIESWSNFTLAAISHIRTSLLSKEDAVSVVLLGDDREFMRDLQLNLSSAAAAAVEGQPTLQWVHLLPEAGMSRGEELCLAATHCNTLLITAPASTYAWWVGYLMMGRWGMRGEGGDGQQGGLILYNGDMGRTSNDTYERGNYPTEWIPLVLNEDGAISEMRDGREERNL